jgi:hypothetical protein
MKVTDLLDGTSHAPGEPIKLQAWDVRLLRSDDQDRRTGANREPLSVLNNKKSF